MAQGTKDDPWVLKTAPGTQRVHDVPRRERRPARARLPGRDRRSCCTTSARSTTCGPGWSAQGDWVPLGAADEQKAAADGTVEAWGRDESNPVGGWYGLRKGYRGRFGMYLPPLLEQLGYVELTHDARNNSVRAI